VIVYELVVRKYMLMIVVMAALKMNYLMMLKNNSLMFLIDLKN